MATGMDLVNAIRDGKAEPPSGIRTLELDRTHHWITSLEPGHIVLEWPYEDRYENLEGAVICVWIAALADQALFLASNTLCGEGEGTRMADFHLRLVRGITEGPVTIDARIRDRVGDQMVCQCEFLTSDGQLAATVDAIIDVTH